MPDLSTRNIRRAAGCLLVLVTILRAQYAEDAVRPFWGLGSPGSRASGLGAAFTGIADDATALYYNPAGLGHLDKPELNIGLNNLTAITNLYDAGDSSTATISSTRLDNLVLAFPIPKAKLTVAGGYHLLHAFERDWEHSYDVSGQEVISVLERVTEQGYLGAWSIGIGYQVTTAAAIGGSIDLTYGEFQYDERNTLFADDTVAAIDIFQVKPSYAGARASLGLLLTPNPNWRIGAMLRSPWIINVDEQSIINDSTIATRYKLQSTYAFELGTSLSLGPLLVASNISWFDYSQVKFKYRSSGDYDISREISINDTLRLEYLSTLGFAVGAEFLVPVINLKLRGGWQLHPPITRLAPNDCTRQTLALGLSYVPMPQLKLDAAYSLTFWERAYDGITENNTAGTLMVNLIYRF